MTLLNDNDLAYLRSEAELILPDTITIQRPSQAPDGRGGYTETWANVYQEIPARMAERTGRERTIGEQFHTEAGWILTVKRDQDITEQDRIVHAARTYEVVWCSTGRSWDTARRCLLQRVG